MPAKNDVFFTAGSWEKDISKCATNWDSLVLVTLQYLKGYLEMIYKCLFITEWENIDKTFMKKLT